MRTLKGQLSAKERAVITILGERYTLTLRHEIVDLETHETHTLEPLLSICYSIYDPEAAAV